MCVYPRSGSWLKRGKIWFPWPPLVPVGIKTTKAPGPCWPDKSSDVIYMLLLSGCLLVLSSWTLLGRFSSSLFFSYFYYINTRADPLFCFTLWLIIYSKSIWLLTVSEKWERNNIKGWKRRGIRKTRQEKENAGNVCYCSLCDDDLPHLNRTNRRSLFQITVYICMYILLAAFWDEKGENDVGVRL